MTFETDNPVAELRAKAREMFPCNDDLARSTYHWHAADEIEKLRVELAARRAVLPAPAGWQPIENAPKDGTWVLGFERYINTKYAPHEVMRWKTSMGTLGWWNSADKSLADVTHWMPLPAAPAPAKLKEG